MKLKLDERLKRSKQMTMLLKFLAGLESLSIDDLDSEDEEEPPEYPGKSPVEVVADYLSEVRKHAWSKLEVKYGTLFKTLTKELVITVPAVWSERAKDLTLKAVTKAQFDVSKISIVTEPEAAAVYTLKYMAQQQDQVRTNDYFVLCDAGGGTVDLISYKITRIAPTYGVEEAVVGNGDKCGATFVEKEFLNWLKNWIGEEAYKKIPPAKLRHGNRLMDDFETYKMNFTGTEEGEEFQVILPRECDIADDDDKSIEDYTLTFTRRVARLR
jgi:molecular chaperone DnaK (HSP70)